MRGSSPRMTLRVWRDPIHPPVIPAKAGIQRFFRNSGAHP